MTGGILNIHADETFAALIIGAAGKVVLSANPPGVLEEAGAGFVSDEESGLAAADDLGGTASVPEPGSLSLLALGALTLSRRRR